MANWSQRQRRGGGVGLQIVMIQTGINTSTNLYTLWSQFVNGVPWELTDFETLPNHHVPTEVFGDADELVELEFGVNITGETALVYKGNHPNLLSPITVQKT